MITLNQIKNNSSYGLNSPKNITEETVQNNRQKNFSILEKYGRLYLNFFSENTTTLPMFMDSSAPRAIKRVVLANEIIIQAGEKVGIYFNPYINSATIFSIKFTGTSTGFTKIGALSDHLKSYASYKVVSSFIKVMQQSILSSNDGYGTTIDGVIAPASFDVYSYGENPNNVNVSFYHRINTVDGRKGIKGLLIGTPFQDYKYPNSELSINNCNSIYGDCYLPFGTSIKYYGDPDRPGTVTYIDGTTELVNGTKLIMKPIVKIDQTQLGSGYLVSSPPDESIFYCRISTPSVSVSYRIYAEVVMEVLPVGNLLEEIPMFSPPVNYSTVRIKQAFEQCYPMIIEGSKITPLNEMMSKKNYQKNFQEDVYYAMDNKTREKVEKRGKNYLKNQKRMERKKRKKLMSDLPPLADAEFKNKQMERNKKIGEVLKGLEESRRLNKEIYKKIFKKQKTRKDIYKEYGRKFIISDSDEEIYYAMDSKIKRKKVMTSNKEVKVKQAPKYVLDCAKELNFPIYQNLSGTDYTKLMRAAITYTPDLEYQFFPIVKDEKTKIAVFTLQRLVEEDKFNGYEEITFNTYNVDGNYSASKFFIKCENLVNKEQFKQDVIDITQYLTTVYYFPFEGTYKMDIFSDNKIDGTSYRLSLFLLLAGVPCGTISTGSFEIKNNEIKFEEFNEEVVRQKASICTPNNPLITVGPNLDCMVSLISGVCPDTLDAPIVTGTDISQVLAYSLIPPTIRRYSNNPFLEFKDEINENLLNDKGKNFMLLLYLREYAKMEELIEFTSKKKLEIKPNFYKKLNPENYVSYLINNKDNKAISVNELVKDNNNFQDLFSRPLIKVDDFWYAPKGILQNILSTNKDININQLILTEEIKKNKEKSERLKNKVSEDTLLEMAEKMKKEIGEKGSNVNRKALNKLLVKEKSKKNQYADLINNIKERAKEEIKKLNKYERGQRSLISNNELSNFWTEIGGANKFTQESLTKMKKNKDIPKLLKIINKETKKGFKPRILKNFFNTIGFEMKSKNLPQASEDEFEQCITILKDYGKADDLLDEISEVSESIKENRKKKEQILDTSEEESIKEETQTNKKNEIDFDEFN